MTTKDVLTLVIATLGASIALATLVKACLEYVHQGRERRAQMFFELRRRLKEPDLAKLAEHIDHAASPDPELSRRANVALARIPLRTKRDYLGLFEEVGLAMRWGLIKPDVAQYMFGYYALLCMRSPAFWIGVGQWDPYWDRFYEFCARMEAERAAFEDRRTKALERALRKGSPTPAGHIAGPPPPPPASDTMPRVTVKIPPVLRPGAAHLRTIEAYGNSVREALEQLVDAYPSMRWQIFCGETDLASKPLRLNRFINVFYDDEEIRYAPKALETPVEDGSTIVLLPATSGG